jgi:hypothetical protein
VRTGPEEQHAVDMPHFAEDINFGPKVGEHLLFQGALEAYLDESLGFGV